MKRHPHLWTVLNLTVACLFVIGTVWVAAQDAVCSLDALWAAASDACIGKPAGYICNGGGAPAAEPQGAVMNALAPVGALVEAKAVDALRTPPIDVNGHGGVAWLRVNDFVQMTGLLLGDIILRDFTPPDFPAWQSLIVTSDPQISLCNAAPRNMFIMQSPPDQPTRVVVNGISLDLNGTVLVQTRENAFTVFSQLSGRLRVLANGQVQAAFAGQQISVAHTNGDFSVPSGFPSEPQPLSGEVLRHIPVALFDRPISLPQPGYAATQGQVNLRAAPSRSSLLLAQVSPGEVLVVLGRNDDGTWYHVQLSSGQTGWMLADLLQRAVGEITAVYQATPQPVQRFGTLGTKARVIAPAGVNLRTAPDVSFGVVGLLPFGTQVDLLARSPYNPWVKVSSAGVVGWVALITVETQAIIDALPVDYDVPPPPLPTKVPGSFGNAFPDPKDGGG